MKKVYVLTLASRRERTVEQLGNLGVLHVSTDSRSNRSMATEVEQKLDRLNRASTLLSDDPIEYSQVPEELTTPQDGVNPSAVVEKLLALEERRSSLIDATEQLREERYRSEPWQNTDPEALKTLDRAGYRSYLYVLTPERYAHFSAEGTTVVIREDKATVHVLLVQTEEQEPPAGHYPRPERSLDDIDTERGRIASELASVQEEIRRVSSLSRTLVDERQRLEAEREFLLVKGHVQNDGSVSFLSGWIPEDMVSTLRKAASEHGWGLLVQDPQEDDEVPVQIRRKGVSRLISPVFDLIKTTPGYHERDISFPFLLFFTVFFAMIISDGGYGLLLFGAAVALTITLRRKQKPAGPPVLLLYVLSIATIFWGAVTGVWFGYEPLSNVPLLESLVIPALDNFEPVSTESLLFICFTLAVMQLSVAHIWNTIDELRGSHKLKALGELGWLSVVLAVYNLVLNLVVNEEVYPLLEITPIAAGAGIVAVILFSNQEGNIFKGVLKGLSVPNLIQTALSSINAFADTVSYIRLFAVGLASVEIAIAANELAIGTGNPVAMILILLVGHTLNVAMGAMSVLVHGIRLNMLEFSGHLGMEWSGNEYKPFHYVRQS
ncbi:MAG: V-type ATP synthase subunit I [Spirochaetaceae bacterium]